MTKVLSLHRTTSLGLSSLLAISLAALGWHVLSVTVSDLSSDDDPVVALTLNPENSGALVDLARSVLSQENVSADGLDSAEADAKKALELNPLNSDAVRLLGRVAEKRGDQARAAGLMETAGNRSLYDTDAQVWLANRSLKDGDARGALYRVDAILRTDPETHEDVLPALMSLADDPTTLGAVVDVLAKNPPWREWFLTSYAAGAEEALKPEALLSALGARNAAPTDPEVGAYLRRLVAEGLFTQAQSTLRRFRPESLSLTGVWPANGDFESPVSGLPFDWELVPIRGASISIEDASGYKSSRALRVEFEGSRVAFRNVRQLMLLNPGPYELSISGRAQDLEAERGLAWRVSCDRGTQIASTSSIKGTTPEWINMKVQFAVPEAGCKAQRLELQIDSRAALEQAITGSAWFDNVTITNLSTR